MASQAGSQAITSQAGTYLPPGEGSNLVAQATQSGRQAGAHLPPREGSSLAASQAGSQASQASQAVNFQTGAHLPRKEAIPQGKQLSGTDHSVRQAGRCSPSPGEEAV